MRRAARSKMIMDYNPDIKAKLLAHDAPIAVEVLFIKA